MNYINYNFDLVKKENPELYDRIVALRKLREDEESE